MVMMRELLVDESTSVLIRVLPNGDVRPTSFIWRDRTRYVSEVGRVWEERIGGKTMHCYLIQSVDNSTFELHWEAGENLWTVHRAWLPAVMA